MRELSQGLLEEFREHEKKRRFYSIRLPRRSGWVP
jgi:hypothetical protein